MGNQSSRAFFGEAMQGEGCLWVPDEERAACFHCETQFNFTCRRHHCRVCGELFCATQRPVYGVKKKKGQADTTATHHSTKNVTQGYGAVDSLDDNQNIEKLGSAPTCWGPKVNLTSNLFPSAVAISQLRLEQARRKQKKGGGGGGSPTGAASKASFLASEIFSNDDEECGGYSPNPKNESGLSSQQKKRRERIDKLVKLLLQEQQAVCTVCYRLLTFPLLRQLSLNIRSVMSDHQPRNVFVVRISLHAITHKRGTAAGSSRNEHFLTLEALARAEAAGLDVVPMMAMMKDKKTTAKLIGQEEDAIASQQQQLAASMSLNAPGDSGSDSLAKRLLAGAVAAQGGGAKRFSLDELPGPTFSLLVPPSTANDDISPASPAYRKAPIGSLLETPAFSVAYPQLSTQNPTVTESRLRAGSTATGGGGAASSNGSVCNDGPDGPDAFVSTPVVTASVDPIVESHISGPNALDVATALTDVLTHHSTRPIGGTGLLEMTLEQWRPFNKQTRFVFRVPDLDLYQGGGQFLEDQLSPMLRKVTIPPLFEAAAMAAELEERRRRNRLLMKREFEQAGVQFPGDFSYSTAMVNRLGNANPTPSVALSGSRRDSGSEVDDDGIGITSPTNGMVEADEQGRLLNFPEPTVRGRVMSGIPGTFLVEKPETHQSTEDSLPTMTPTTHLILAAGTGSRGGHRAGEFKPTKQGNAHTSDFGEAETGRDEAAKKADEAARLQALALRAEPVSAEELLRMRQAQDEQERLAEVRRVEQEHHDMEEFARLQEEAAELDRQRKEAEMERRRQVEEAKKAARRSKPYFNVYHAPTSFDGVITRSVDERNKNDEFADYSVPAKITLASNSKSNALEKAYEDFNSTRRLDGGKRTSYLDDNGDMIEGAMNLQQEGSSAVSSAMFLEDPSLPAPAVSERRIKAAFHPTLNTNLAPMPEGERRHHEKKAIEHNARQFRQDTIVNKLSAVPGATPIMAPSSVMRPSRLNFNDDAPLATSLSASVNGTSGNYGSMNKNAGSTLSGAQSGVAPFLQHTAAHQEEIAKQLSHINYQTPSPTGSPVAPPLPLRGGGGGSRGTSPNNNTNNNTTTADTSIATFKSGLSAHDASSSYHASESAVAPALKKKSRRGKRFTDLSLHIAEDGSQLEVKLPPVWSLSCSSIVGIELMQGRQVDSEKIAEEKKRSAEKVADEEDSGAPDRLDASANTGGKTPTAATPTKPSKTTKAGGGETLPTAGSAPVPLGVVGTHYLRVETFQEIYYFTFDIDHQQHQGVVKREMKALRKRDKHRSGYTALEEEARRNLGMSAAKNKDTVAVGGDVGSAVHLRPLGDLYSAITGYAIPDAASLTAAGMVEALKRKKNAKDGKSEPSMEGGLIMPRSSPEAVVNYLDEDLTDPDKVRQMRGGKEDTKSKGKAAASSATPNATGLPSTADGLNRPLNGADLYGAMRQAVDMARVRGRVRVSSVRIGAM